MEIVHEMCCRIDVHAKTAVVCLIRHGTQEIRTCSTMTDDLLKMSDGLAAEGCTHVAIESAGVYWRPVFNLLEGVWEVVLVDARYVNGVPGRKTEVKDCEWSAEWLSHGLVKASFTSPRHIREPKNLLRREDRSLSTFDPTAEFIFHSSHLSSLGVSQLPPNPRRDWHGAGRSRGSPKASLDP